MNRLTIFVVCLVASLAIAKSIPSPTCGPMCTIYCPYGNVLDSTGCPTCTCKETPCENNQAPLADYSCASTLSGHNCPSTHYCNDAYAVCCPRVQWM
jgi:hypothetical protein